MGRTKNFSETLVNRVRERRKEKPDVITLDDYVLLAIPSVLYNGRVGAEEQSRAADGLKLPRNIFTKLDCTFGTVSGMTLYYGAHAGTREPSFISEFVSNVTYRFFNVPADDFFYFMMWFVLGVNTMRFTYTMLTGKPVVGFGLVSTPLAIGRRMAGDVYEVLPEPTQAHLSGMKDTLVEGYQATVFDMRLQRMMLQDNLPKLDNRGGYMGMSKTTDSD